MIKDLLESRDRLFAMACEMERIEGPLGAMSAWKRVDVANAQIEAFIAKEPPQ